MTENKNQLKDLFREGGFPDSKLWTDIWRGWIVPVGGSTPDRLKDDRRIPDLESLPSVFRPLSSVFRPSSSLCLLLSVLCPLSSGYWAGGNWERKRRSFSKNIRKSRTPYNNIAKRSTPTPNAKP